MKGWVVLMLGLSASAATAHAQQGEAGEGPDVPAQYAPPPGMCRVWLAGVPAAQQPAPTDCATAIRKRPSQGRVLFGVNRETARPVLMPVRPLAPESDERRPKREPVREERREPARAEPRAEPRKEPRAEQRDDEPRARSRPERTRRSRQP